MECYTCNSLSGKKPLFPESKMHEGKYWVLEHIYPSSVKGWLVLVLKRHAETLHSLSNEEFKELNLLLNKTTKLLHKEVNCEKEYTFCLAEEKHFNHIHFHIIAKPRDLPIKYTGANIFKSLKQKNMHISKSDIVAFCMTMKSKISQQISS